MAVGNLLDGGLQLRRPHVVGRRVDQIADQRYRARQRHRLVDPRRIGAQQDTPLRGLAAAAVAVEAVLREQPAERGRAGRAFGQAVGAVGKFGGDRGEIPWAGIFGLRQHSAPLVALVAGDQREFAGLAVEAGRRRCRAEALGLRRHPFVEPTRVDDMEDVRGLAAIGQEQRGEIGHGVSLERFRAAGNYSAA